MAKQTFLSDRKIKIAYEIKTGVKTRYQVHKLHSGDIAILIEQVGMLAPRYVTDEDFSERFYDPNDYVEVFNENGWTP